jgi:hypothetical protein
VSVCPTESGLRNGRGLSIIHSLDSKSRGCRRESDPVRLLECFSYPSYSVLPIEVSAGAVYVRFVPDTSREYAAIIQALGAEFRGVELGPSGALILFADPLTRSTLAVLAIDFSAQAVSSKLEESRRAFDLDAHVQKSLC